MGRHYPQDGKLVKGGFLKLARLYKVVGFLGVFHFKYLKLGVCI